MLGPLAVDAFLPQARRRRRADGRARSTSPRQRGHRAVILLGDAPYYARFGFSTDKTGELSLPGPFERDRLLGLELREGALDGAWGMIAPTGAPLPSTRQAAPKTGASPCRARPEGTTMPESLPTRDDAARPRLRSVVTDDPPGS